MPPKPFEAGTHLWIRTDDGIFWPAIVCREGDFEADMLPFMLTDGGRVPDTCARFYHDKFSVFPIDSSDSSTVKLATWGESDLSNPSLRAEVAEHQRLVNQKGVSRLVDMVKASLTSEADRPQVAQPQQGGFTFPSQPQVTAASSSFPVAPAHAPPTAPLPVAPNKQPSIKVINTLGLKGDRLKKAQALLSALNPADSAVLSGMLNQRSDEQEEVANHARSGKIKKTRSAKPSQSNDESTEEDTLLDILSRNRSAYVPATMPMKVPMNAASSRAMPSPAALAAVSQPSSQRPSYVATLPATPPVSRSTTLGTAEVTAPPVAVRPKFTHMDGWDDSRLHHLRYSLFDVNLPHSKDSLDPSWLFHSVIGAVTIPDASKASTVEFEGIDRDLGYSFGSRAGASMGRGGRRVLLVAMGTEFKCDHGWMEPIPITESILLTMRIEMAATTTDPDYDTGVGSAVPKNWRLPSSQQDAIKSFIPMDVTDAFQAAVRSCPANSDSLSVRMNVFVEHQSHARDIALWGGVLALIAAAPVTNEQICKWITTRPQPSSPISPPPPQSAASRSGSLLLVRSASGAAPKRSREDDAVKDDDDEVGDIGMTVSVQCPISLQLMEVPCRGVRCTHQQCCELAYIVEICTSTKVWACPYCKGHMPFREMLVDMPLMDYIGDTSARYREREPMALYMDGKYVKVSHRQASSSSLRSASTATPKGASSSRPRPHAASSGTLTQVDSFCIDD